ncbi:DUF5996 family protein [Mycolicibacterium hodleri]|uniref:DUF5996 family protein n=1 Tax=Mycolicibacterium hodleri TaxID=49897 RepID=UPI001F1E8665|nr:DUF5996 family protein [Mycolicibacterium hodleri]
MTAAERANAWPELNVEEWASTRMTLHMWVQIVGKIRLARAPMVNHWWQVPLYVSSRGLTTSAIPYGAEAFEVEFDFIDHVLRISCSSGTTRTLDLRPQTVAQFYSEVMTALDSLSIPVSIWPSPVEVEPAIPFAEDDVHRAYDADHAHRFWRQLISANRVFHDFRAEFIGKVSPVHFFWGAMDLACTRFSGRTAPMHKGGAPHLADWVMVEAYSHEVSSCGFWPGGSTEGSFYSYAYPAPTNFDSWSVRPDSAYYGPGLGEFLLPYEAVRTSEAPERTLLQFLRSTYDAAANLADWDHAALEAHSPLMPSVPVTRALHVGKERPAHPRGDDF